MNRVPEFCLRTGCNADTEHVSDESTEAQAKSELAEAEVNSWRRLAVTMLAVGSLGCGIAAVLACVASVVSGQALLSSHGASGDGEVKL